MILFPLNEFKLIKGAFIRNIKREFFSFLEPEIRKKLKVIFLELKSSKKLKVIFF